MDASESISRTPKVDSLTDQALAKLREAAEIIIADAGKAYEEGLTRQVALLTKENQELIEQNQALLAQNQALMERIEQRASRGGSP